MAEENEGQQRFKQVVAQDKRFWMLAVEWIEVAQESAITGAGRTMARRRAQNEVCNIHPLVYSVVQQRERHEFSIRWAMEIDEELYDWVMSNQPVRPEEPQPNGLIG